MSGMLLSIRWSPSIHLLMSCAHPKTSFPLMNVRAMKTFHIGESNPATLVLDWKYPNSSSIKWGALALFPLKILGKAPMVWTSAVGGTGNWVMGVAGPPPDWPPPGYPLPGGPPPPWLPLCYVYGLCLPLQTYLWTDKWVTVWKRLRTSLGTPLCILFRFLLTYWHFLTLLGRCTVHGTLLTEGSASVSALDSCIVQETSMADGSASEALQTCVLYSVLYMETYFTLYCTWQCHIGHTCI